MKDTDSECRWFLEWISICVKQLIYSKSNENCFQLIIIGARLSDSSSNRSLFVQFQSWWFQTVCIFLFLASLQMSLEYVRVQTDFMSFLCRFFFFSFLWVSFVLTNTCLWFLMNVPNTFWGSSFDHFLNEMYMMIDSFYASLGINNRIRYVRK